MQSMEAAMRMMMVLIKWIYEMRRAHARPSLTFFGGCFSQKPSSSLSLSDHEKASFERAPVGRAKLFLANLRESLAPRSNFFRPLTIPMPTESTAFLASISPPT